MSENQVTTEGNNVAEAIAKASEILGIPAEQVDHKLDLSHFRNEAGRAIPVDTVKIIAWAADPSDKAGALAAKAWIEDLVSKMGFEGNITARNVKNRKATIAVDSESARFLVGRGGATLQSIQKMLNVAMEEEYSDWTFDIDVQGGRRDERRDRDGDRRGGRDRDRGDRRGGRDRGGRDRGGRDRDRCSDRDVRELKRLARRVAEAVVDGGESEIIRKPLNSFERRIVHTEVAEIDGVGTETIDQDGERKIRIFIDNGEGAAAEA